jgi:hypothetical protein
VIEADLQDLTPQSPRAEPPTRGRPEDGSPTS